MASTSAFHFRRVAVRIHALLTKEERKKSLRVFAVTVINSFVDILGIAAVLPVIGVVLQPEMIHENQLLVFLYEQTGVESERDFILVLVAGMMLAFVFKAIFGLLTMYVQSHYAFSVGLRLSGVMWSYHFKSSIEKMRSSESGRFQATINAWPVQFAKTFLTGALFVMNELFVMLLIGIGLLVYNPLILLSIGAVLGAGLLIIRRTTKNRLSAYARLQSVLDPKSLTLISNALRGFLEVITFRATDAVRDAYIDTRKQLFRLFANRQVIVQIPARFYEVLAVGVIAMAILIAMLLEWENRSFFQLLSLLALAAYRIMPSLSRVNNAVMMMRSQMHILDEIERGAEAVYAKENNAGADAKEVKGIVEPQKISIQIEKLSLGYESLDEPVIEEMSHVFPASGVHAIVGPSGSGKSTLISALLGLHAPLSGQINVVLDDHTVHLTSEITSQKWLGYVGYLSQSPFLFAGSVRDNLTLRVPGREIDEERVMHLIKKLDLMSCLGSDPLRFNLHEGGANLSGGQQQRLALLRALQVERQVLILDEATSALDSVSRDVVFELLREQARRGCNVILVTHDREIAAQCDTVLSL